MEITRTQKKQLRLVMNTMTDQRPDWAKNATSPYTIKVRALAALSIGGQMPDVSEQYLQALVAEVDLLFNYQKISGQSAV